jgi:hypothetical protein
LKHHAHGKHDASPNQKINEEGCDANAYTSRIQRQIRTFRGFYIQAGVSYQILLHYVGTSLFAHGKTRFRQSFINSGT